MNVSILRLDRSGRMAASSLRRSRAAAARRWRPNLDQLEERRLLSTTITVNSLLDQTDAPGSTTVTLRDAINEANADGGATIQFQSSPSLASEVSPVPARASSPSRSSATPASARRPWRSSPGISITIIGPTGNAGITIERAPSAERDASVRGGRQSDADELDLAGR